MILVDTSVIVAWLNCRHPHHRACAKAIEHWALRERLAVSTVTYGETAAGGRTREAVEEDLRDFQKNPAGRGRVLARGHGLPAISPPGNRRSGCRRIFSQRRPGSGVEPAAFDE